MTAQRNSLQPQLHLVAQLANHMHQTQPSYQQLLWNLFTAAAILSSIRCKRLSTAASAPSCRSRWYAWSPYALSFQLKAVRHIYFLFSAITNCLSALWSP